jgi:autophagy-related protein 2
LPLKINLDHNVYVFVRDYVSLAMASSLPTSSPSPVEDAGDQKEEMFFDKVEIGGVNLLLDYKPLTIDQTTNVTDILNVIHIEKASLDLTKLRLNSVPSLSALTDAVISAWKPQALRSLPGAFGSIRGINYVLSIGSALSDLVLIPYSEYQRGGAVSILPSLVKAGSSALSKATKEIINVAATTSTVIQGVAERGERLVSEETPSLGTSPPSKFANQPANISEGLRQGYESVSRELREARDAIVVVPLAEYNLHGAQGLFKHVVRAVPIAVLKPVIGASKGVSRVLLGARNQMDQTEKMLSDDKYRSSTSTS